MADAWNPRAARRKLAAQPDTLAADALLDQHVFSGVGNIIKNEVLHRIRVHPESTVGALPSRKLGEMISRRATTASTSSNGRRPTCCASTTRCTRRRHCPRDGTRLSYRKHLGLAGRRAFWCDTCQRLYPTARVPSRHDRLRPHRRHPPLARARRDRPQPVPVRQGRRGEGPGALRPERCHRAGAAAGDARRGTRAPARRRPGRDSTRR